VRGRVSVCAHVAVGGEAGHQRTSPEETCLPRILTLELHVNSLLSLLWFICRDKDLKDFFCVHRFHGPLNKELSFLHVGVPQRLQVTKASF
jgi:hypothetical protein